MHAGGGGGAEGVVARGEGGEMDSTYVWRLGGRSDCGEFMVRDASPPGRRGAKKS